MIFWLEHIHEEEKCEKQFFSDLLVYIYIYIYLFCNIRMKSESFLFSHSFSFPFFPWLTDREWAETKTQLHVFCWASTSCYALMLLNFHCYVVLFRILVYSFVSFVMCEDLVNHIFRCMIFAGMEWKN